MSRPRSASLRTPSGSVRNLPRDMAAAYALDEGPPLGKGASGSVYRGRRTWHSSGSTHAAGGGSAYVAVKCIPRASLDKAASDRLVSEVAILKSCHNQCDNVAGLLDFYWSSRWIYVVLPYCRGGDARQWLDAHGGTLGAAQTRSLIAQLAGALRYLRSRDIAHLDLKPSNILLDEACTPGGLPTIKVADFGISQQLAAGNTSSHKIGSVAYMAPEVAAEQVYDASVDLFSVGAIMHECLFGYPPALPPGEAGDIDSILLRLVIAGRTREPWPLPAADADGFGDGVLSLLRSLLQPDPVERLSFDELFAHPYVTAAPAPASGSRASAAPSAVAWQSQTSG